MNNDYHRLYLKLVNKQNFIVFFYKNQNYWLIALVEEWVKASVISY